MRKGKLIATIFKTELDPSIANYNKNFLSIWYWKIELFSLAFIKDTAKILKKSKNSEKSKKKKKKKNHRNKIGSQTSRWKKKQQTKNKSKKQNQKTQQTKQTNIEEYIDFMTAITKYKTEKNKTKNSITPE